jgi:hypothetical protein
MPDLAAFRSKVGEKQLECSTIIGYNKLNVHDLESVEATMPPFCAILRTSPADWTADQLTQLSAIELEYLCRLLAIPHTGTKSARVGRLLDAADLRTILAPYTHPDQMTPIFSHRTLAALAKRAGTWNGGSKWGLANGLLGWRNECRRKGQQFHDETTTAARALRAGQPHQERMF